MGDDGRPAPGTWSGLLFGNPVVRLPPALTWSFRFPLAPAGGEPAALDVDWVPLPVTGWRAMAGSVVSADEFADPVEASVQDRGHHRYQRVALRVTDQDGERIRVAVTVAGDLDGYGRDEVSAAGWLRFTGITVQLGGVTAAGAALRRLAGFTDAGALAETGDPRGIAFRFVPR